MSDQTATPDKQQPVSVETGAVQIRIRPASPDDPGFLRRQRMYLRWKQLQETGEMRPEDLDEFVAFMAQFIINMEHGDAIEAIWELSQNQWNDIMRATTSNQEAEPPLSQSDSLSNG